MKVLFSVMACLMFTTSAHALIIGGMVGGEWLTPESAPAELRQAADDGQEESGDVQELDEDGLEAEGEEAE